MPEEKISLQAGLRRTEDIALDLMKFIAITTGYGKPAVSAGFQAKAEKSEDVAEGLLQLYDRCRAIVEKPAGRS
jgi:hypothetical protein